MVTLSVYLFQQIYIKTEMYLEMEMGFTEVAVDSDEMKFLSITFCPAFMNHMNLNEVDNITADYQNLSRAEDMLVSVRQAVSINK